METILDVQLLEYFILNNPDLEKLEKILSSFNVFETLGIIDTEIRHSNVLSWLLNPNLNHGLGEFFVKQFLKHIISKNKQIFLPHNISLFDFEIFSYADIEIRREWNNIDILVIVNEQKQNYVIAIENKVRSSEHSNQLQRYVKIIEDEFKDSKLIFVFLTPDDVIPSDNHWATFSYSDVADLLDDLLTYKKDSLSKQVYNFIQHYQVIIRRYIVGNSEVEQICQQIYKKHQKAIDLIIRYKPDMDLGVSEYLQEAINNNEELILDASSKSAIRFTTKTIDGLVEKCGDGWTNSKRVLLYEFLNNGRRLVLKLYIGIGPKEFREKLRDFCSKDASLFKIAGKNIGYKWDAVYQKEFLKSSDYDDARIEELKEKINIKFAEFLKGDSAKIDQHFKQGWQV